MAILAPCLSIFLREIQDAYGITWPRKGSLDGWIGDPAHQNRPSDHNPDERGVVAAFDIDIRSKFGKVDPYEIIEVGIQDPDQRVNYFIHDGFIWNDDTGYQKQRFGGHAHRLHLHCSSKQASRFEDNTKPWGLVKGEIGMSDSYMFPKKGDKSERVRKFQRLYNEAYPSSAIKADGDYGNITTAAFSTLGDKDYDGSYTSSWVETQMERDRLARIVASGQSGGDISLPELTDALIQEVINRLRN